MKKILSLLAGLLCLLASYASADSIEGYTFTQYRTVTIDHTQVAESGTVPVLFSVTNKDFAQWLHNGFVHDPNGYDLIFTDTNNNLLPFKIAKWNATTGAIQAYVLTSVNTGSDTYYRVWFCSEDCHADLSDVAVWDSDDDGAEDEDYRLVAHLDTRDGTAAGGSTEADSTAFGNDITANYAWMPPVTGKIGNAIDCYPGTIYGYGTIDDTSNTSLDPGSAITIACWIYEDATQSNKGILAKYGGTDLNWILLLYSGANDTPKFIIDVGGVAKTVTWDSTISTGAWHYIVAVYDGSNVKMSIDGAAFQTGDSCSSCTIDSSDQTVDLGSYAESSSYVLDGKIDEVRVSGSARSIGYVQTQYAMQDDPNSFSSLGSRVSVGGEQWLTGYYYKRLVPITTIPEADYPASITIWQDRTGDDNQTDGNLDLDGHYNDWPNDIIRPCDVTSGNIPWFYHVTDNGDGTATCDMIPRGEYSASTSFYAYYYDKEGNAPGETRMEPIGGSAATAVYAQALLGSFHPQAMYSNYSGTSKTVFVYGDWTDMDPYTAAYNHATKTFTGFYKVMDANPADNLHSAAALMVDPHGYIQYIGASYNGLNDGNPVQWTKTVDQVTEDDPFASGFETPFGVLAAYSPSYTNLVQVGAGNDLWMFSRQHTGSNSLDFYAVSTDWDQDWSSVEWATHHPSFGTPVPYADFTDGTECWKLYFDHIAKDSVGDIHVTGYMHDVHAVVIPEDIYYTRYDVSEGKWKTSSGDCYDTVQITLSGAPSGGDSKFNEGNWVKGGTSGDIGEVVSDAASTTVTLRGMRGAAPFFSVSETLTEYDDYDCTSPTSDTATVSALDSNTCNSGYDIGQLPIRWANKEMLLDENYVIVYSIDVDANDKPYILYRIIDPAYENGGYDGPSEMYITTMDNGGTWHTKLITDDDGGVQLDSMLFGESGGVISIEVTHTKRSTGQLEVLKTDDADGSGSDGDISNSTWYQDAVLAQGFAPTGNPSGTMWSMWSVKRVPNYADEPNQDLKLFGSYSRYGLGQIWAYGAGLGRTQSRADTVYSCFDNAELDRTAVWQQEYNTNTGTDDHYQFLDNSTSHSGTYCILLDPDSGANSNGYYFTATRPIAHGLTSIWVRFPDTTHNRYIIARDDADTEGAGNTIWSIRFYTNGDIYYGASDTGVNYSANTWEHLIIWHDSDENSVYGSYEGTLLNSGSPIGIDSPFDPMQQLEIKITTDTDTMQFDDMVVRTYVDSDDDGTEDGPTVGTPGSVEGTALIRIQYHHNRLMREN